MKASKFSNAQKAFILKANWVLASHRSRAAFFHFPVTWRKTRKIKFKGLLLGLNHLITPLAADSNEAFGSPSVGSKGPPSLSSFQAYMSASRAVHWFP
jgi:hypothetical protein